MTAPHEDPAEVKALRRAQRAKKDDRVHLTESARWVMSDPRGWVLVEWLEQIGLCDQQVFATDPYRTAFNAGQNNVGLQIRATVQEADPQAYARMMNARIAQRGEDEANG